MKFLALCFLLFTICSLSSSWAAPLELEGAPLTLLAVDHDVEPQAPETDNERVARGLGLGGFGGLGGLGGKFGGFGSFGGLGLGHGFGGGFGGHGFGGHGFGGGLGGFKGLFNKHFR